MKWAMVLVLGVMVAGVTGCVSDNYEIGDLVGEFAGTTGLVRRAVVAGLTKVNPDSYMGWDGDCPGSDVDAETFALLCREQGLQVAELHNEQASLGALTAVARTAWSDMKSGDLFVLYVSGHGGQLYDYGGDEDDRQDETLCLWDGECTDDRLREFWEEIPDGVRVFFVTDTCNSGTNYRYRPRSLRRAVPRDFAGALIHYGGCADGESSYGDEQGGSWTTALIDGWGEDVTYESWFTRAGGKMPPWQVPVYGEYGTVTDAFRQERALR